MPGQLYRDVVHFRRAYHRSAFRQHRQTARRIERLIANGGSILIIEHNLDVIESAGWIVDLGPEGGEGGGRIVAQGTPEQVAQVAQVEGSYTGSFSGECWAVA